MADDAADQFVKLALERRVVGNLCTRGNRDQHQRHAPMIARIGFEETLETEQALEDALGVVEPVHAQHHVWGAERAADALCALLHARARGESCEVVGWDAERKDADAHGPAMSRDLVARTVDAQPQYTLAAV